MFYYKKIIYVLVLGLSICFLTGCIEDESAFDILESPVLAVFEDMDASETGAFKVKAKFYELDKTNILDNNIGIDSIPISNLSVKVFVFESTLVGDLSTDSEGEVIIEESFDALLGSSRLEWVGTYKDIPFRIYKNL